MADHYTAYYLNQVQTGSGMAYYAGANSQRGGGLFGSFLSGLFRFVQQLLPTIGREVARAGSHVLSDIASGSNSVASSVKRHASEAGSNMLNMAAEKMRGKGIKRRPGRSAPQSGPGRRTVKRPRYKDSLS